MKIKQELVNKLGEWQISLLSLIEDDDYQGFFQDGKDGSNLLDGLTKLHDEIAATVRASGLEPKGCCSEG